MEGFYKKTVAERLEELKSAGVLSADDVALLKKSGAGALDVSTADKMVENVVGVMGLPLGFAVNFKVNGRELLVPMAVEEPSVIAAASHAAKICLPEGFAAKAGPSIMRGQIHLVGVKDADAAVKAVAAAKKDVIEKANSVDAVLVKLGGGARDLKARVIESKMGKVVVVELYVDVKDAMGANAVNSMCEAVAPLLEKTSDGRARLKILSNLCPERITTAKATWKKEVVGVDVVAGVVEAAALAEADHFRATTANKGIMNGVDAVVIATGNDWRAVEAACHSYAAYGKKYSSLTRFRKNNAGDLEGEIALPLALGIVGGATKSNSVAQLSLKILGVKTAGELAEVVACVGLANNFAALRALSTEGIQKGHMRLHARNVAIAAGAKGKDVDVIAERMAKDRNVSVEKARELLRR